MVPATEPRTRWRLTVARSAEAADVTQREVEATWVAAVDRSGVPVVRGDDGRPRLTFGAPLPVRMAAEHEYVDVLLTDRWPRWRVREGLEPVIPAGWTLRELADVWIGGPALAAAVVGADYRITLGGGPDAVAVAAAAAAMLAASTLPRTRAKGAGTVTYDLRPLLVRLEVVEPGPPVVVRARTRIHPTLGSGRPDEVVAELSERLGVDLEPTSVVREQLILPDEVDARD